jgi:hypothetical protein
MSRRNFSQPSLADAFVKSYSRGGGVLVITHPLATGGDL